MILKARTAFGAVLVVLLCSVLSVYSFSLTQKNFETYVKPKCFNQSTVLGQVRPNGMTVENLISMIQRMELQYPTMKPTEILALFLQRFQLDGMFHDRQSNTGFRHSNLAQVILDDNLNRQPNFDLIEKIFTEDEKCNLFFTLSHSVNQTAEEDEHDDNKYMAPSQSRAPIVAEKPKQNMGHEVPVQMKKDPKDLPPVSSGFVGDDDDDDKPNVPSKGIKGASNKRFKREEMRRLLTKKPREFGVASFLGASTEPIAMGRVLLGLYAGYAGKNKQRMSQILQTLNAQMAEGVEDRDVDPLMAVTLADLYGLIPDNQISPTKWNFFGAEGSWNNTECQTKFVLSINEGIWVTASDFRGAIDGFNLGKSIEFFRNDLTASQALRFYYSKQGFVESGICKREDTSRSEIEQDLKREGETYLHMWNSYYYGNQHDQADIKNYINNVEQPFREEMRKAREPNSEEQALCNSGSYGKIDSAEVETNADVYFMLDAKNDCDDPTNPNDQPTQKTADQCKKTSQIISRITRQLRLNRHHGTVSVFYNVKSLDGNNLVGDSGEAVSTKLHSRLFNSTSNQCPSCRALDPQDKSLDTVEKRLELFTLMKEQIVQLKKAERADKQGLPAKIFYWFDVGTVENLGTDKAKKLEIDNVLRDLKVTHRDVQYFGVGTDETKLSDLVTQQGQLINLNDVNKYEQFVQSAMKVPQIFEYPNFVNATSKNVTVENYITPGYRQFWMMSPTQFIRSKDVTLSFKATDYAIEVCFGRDPEPEKKTAQCKNVDNAGESVSFKISTPCQERFEKCPPFYFTVAVKENTKSSIVNKHCIAKECQNIKQTPWYFSHTNVRGSNGSAALGASVLLISIAFILQKFFSFSL